ncbi:MAG: hypothetical protein WBC51_18780 [Vicinamibacterales bacterium]
MPRVIRPLAILLVFFGAVRAAGAEVLVRWDQSQVPSQESLGISTLVVPAKNAAAIKSAREQGYRLFVQIDAAEVMSFVPPAGSGIGVLVSGKPSPAQLKQLRQRLGSTRLVVPLDERGKWPHIRSNWVTKNNGVLQVTGRSAQPWIENNAALLRLARPEDGHAMQIFSYTWQPVTLSDVDEGPSLDDYLVAIAESGSFGGDLLLPLHERFERNLLLGQPQARSDWMEIRRYIEFYSWNLPDRYQPMVNVGVVTSEPTLWFEVMNLLARHNLPFHLIPPKSLASRPLKGIDLLIVLDEPLQAQNDALAAFEHSGGQVIKMLKGVADPNAFALDVRQKLGRQHRVVDIWNGITVLVAPFQEPNGENMLLTTVNYAHQELPVQLRVKGTFSQVRYESPEEPVALIPGQQRDGFTEFVLPSLRVGGRVFLGR